MTEPMPSALPGPPDLSAHTPMMAQYLHLDRNCPVEKTYAGNYAGRGC